MGDGTLKGIHGPVSVAHSSAGTLGGGSTSLSIDDSSDIFSRTVSVSGTAIGGPGLPTIGYVGGAVSAVTFSAGSGDNTFTFSGTGAGSAFSLRLGSGTNAVNVQATGGPLAINNDHAADHVDSIVIGSQSPNGAGSLAGIAGPVTISNTSRKPNLTVDDVDDVSSRVVSLSASSISGFGLPTITYGTLSSLSFAGGSGGNTITVADTPGDMILHSGSGSDLVSVRATHGALTVQGDGGDDIVWIGSQTPVLGGTLTGIAGPLSVANQSGHTALAIDDSGDSLARTTTITSSAVSGMTASPLAYGQGVASLTVHTSGHGGSLTNILSTAVATTIVGGSPIYGPDDSVVIGSAGLLSGIAGAVNVTNPGGFTSLTVDGSAAVASQAVTVGPGSIDGLAPATISFGPKDVRTVKLRGGKGANSLTGFATGSTFDIMA